MFLLFGTRSYLRSLTEVRFACQYCGQVARQEVYRASNKLTLFFLVPLFTISRSYFNRCTNCGGETRLTAEQARRGMDWAERGRAVGPDRH